VLIDGKLIRDPAFECEKLGSAISQVYRLVGRERACSMPRAQDEQEILWRLKPSVGQKLRRRWRAISAARFTNLPSTSSRRRRIMSWEKFLRGGRFENGNIPERAPKIPRLIPRSSGV
jgi:hypothetical protein